MKGRSARVAERWHGPAVVVGRNFGGGPENEKGYWIGHSGRLLLVSLLRLRLAVGEERLADQQLRRFLHACSGTM
eukprot:1253376-Alexandrium_andersonii.AAC.1